MTHTDEKPHVCEECDSAYKTLDALQRHQRLVTLLRSIHIERKSELNRKLSLIFVGYSLIFLTCSFSLSLPLSLDVNWPLRFNYTFMV